MSGSNCCFLTCIQISQEAGKVVWYSHLFKNFPQFVVIHTVKDFSVVNEADVIQWMLAIWSLVPLPFLNPAEHLEVLSSHTVEAQLAEFWALLCYQVRWVQLCGTLNILWHCLSLQLESKLTFSIPVATAKLSKFPGILSSALSSHQLLGFEIAQLEFHHLY